MSGTSDKAAQVAAQRVTYAYEAALLDAVAGGVLTETQARHIVKAAEAYWDAIVTEELRRADAKKE